MTNIEIAFNSSQKDYTLEEKNEAMDYADSILPTSVYDGESVEEYQLHKIMEAAFIEGAKWKDKQSNELIEKAIGWFNDIAELCEHLTTGNIAHMRAIIRGKAIRSAEFLTKRLKRENDEDQTTKETKKEG